MTRLLLLLCAAVAWAQNPATAVFPGGTLTDTIATVACSRVNTTTTGSMTDTSPTVTVASTAGMLVGCTLAIGSEDMQITGISGLTLTLTRGFDGAVAVPHASNSRVAGNITRASHNQLVKEVQAVQAGDFGSRTVKGAAFESNDTTHSGADLLSGLTSGGLAWAVADVAGTLTTLIYPTDSSTATTGKVLAIGDVVTCPTLPAGMPSTCRATSWATGGSMTYPGAGVPNSTGSAWGTSYSVTTSVGTPGSDTALPTEQAVREAIVAGSSGYVSAPATPGATGSTGNWSADGSYFYAYAGSRWNRAAWDATWLEQVATPTFDPVAGTYTGTQSVTIATTTAGDTICYTTDGSSPAASTPGTCSAGSTYSTPVSVAASGTLKAIGTKSGMTNSAEASAAYTINAPATTTARAFNGTSGRLNGSTAEFASGASAFTIAFWIKSASTAQTNAYVLDLNGNSLVSYGYANDGGVAQVELIGSVGDALRTGSQITVPDTGWHHIAYRYNGTEWAKFLDGSKTVISASISSGINTGSSPFKVGTSGTANLFAGSIARVYLSTSALTDGQISTLAGTCSTSGVSGTVGYWLLLGDASPETESSPSAGSNSLTVTAATKDTGGPGCSAQ